MRTPLEPRFLGKLPPHPGMRGPPHLKGGTPLKPGSWGHLPPHSGSRGPPFSRGTLFKNGYLGKLPPNQGLRSPPISRGNTPQTWVSGGAATAPRVKGTPPPSEGTLFEPLCQGNLSQHPGSRGHPHLWGDTPPTWVTGGAGTAPRVEGTSYFQGDNPWNLGVGRSFHSTQSRGDPHL